MNYERIVKDREIQRQRVPSKSMNEDGVYEDGYKFNKHPKKSMSTYTYYSILRKKEVKRYATKGGAAKTLTNSWSRVNPGDRPAEVCFIPPP